MRSEQDTAYRLRLSYRPTQRQCAQIVAARGRASGRTRRVLLALALLAVSATLSAATGGSGTAAFSPAIVIGLAVGVLVVRPRRETRALHERAVRCGGHEVVVDGDGVRVEHDLGSERITWEGLADYTETDDLFVLFDDEDASHATVVPKDRLSAEDTAALRAFMDSRLRQA
ncbi:YcxB family protein [Streptomyces sp. VRA16 Mangrove soil]|uniref:YcxB family protein n=1 Tax=Streptomyces sp. VRA16 Mangrove soil TaxID=2817434 RepID=UPI001A9E2890|nr:YcxB family protein [Streptomyces sp. VRA16 Mangrove soil]MBO1336920.1 YcxB family protein [Streptomyces sp. VRA16 Mangrove soil]